jgi:MFS family permease
MTLGIVCFGFVREPEAKISSTRRTVMEVIREIPAILRRDANYRRLFFTQVLSAGLGFSLPFYVVLAREVFGASDSATGVFLVTQTLGATAATAIWGRLSTRQGNRQVVLITILAQAVIPIYALFLSVGFSQELHGAPEWVVTAAFAPIFLLIGATMSGSMIGFTSFLLDIAPEDRRPTYIGMSNTSMGCASFFPALGGILADLAHLQGVFVVSAVMVVAAVVLSRRLQEPD